MKIAIEFKQTHPCVSNIKMELTSGLEPPNLFLTKEVLYLLSYVSTVYDTGAGNGNRTRIASLGSWYSTTELCPQMVERDGFKPSKSVTTDLESAPFGLSGTSPYNMVL